MNIFRLWYILEVSSVHRDPVPNQYNKTCTDNDTILLRAVPGNSYVQVSHSALLLNRCGNYDWLLATAAAATTTTNTISCSTTVMVVKWW